MLSTENPPPDPQCCRSNEKPSDNNNHHQLEVDLLKYDNNNNPLPKFSIRDYVFGARGKDIKNNWPFSQKNLQLCLKHGVKDVLPPFQSLDSVRNPSSSECENLSYSDVKHSESSDHRVQEKLAEDVANIDLSESEEDKEFPSTTTSQSCSDINSVPPITRSCLSPREKPEFTSRGAKKVESNIHSPVKKCRLIVKLNNIAEPKSNEDLPANTAVVSETMTSKVCPVCKTFSSSSNTTLNAHIDQCLSGESTIKWTTNSKMIKHRIKPRKTRLMVDIYETALHYTLEDLDKRNGTNWASNLGLPFQDLEACAEENKKKYSPVNIEDSNEEGAVYIDSSGTKLRILSKLSQLPSQSNPDYESGPSKFEKRESLSKKKKYILQKHKLQNHAPDGPKSCHHKHEVDDDQQKILPSEGHEEEDITQPLMASDQMKLNDFGMIKQWVGSKRTGLKKKINLDHENQHVDISTRNSRVKSVSSLGDTGDTITKGNTASISPLISSDENPLLPTESHSRKENLSYDSHDVFMELPHQRKRPGSPLLKSRNFNDRKNHTVFSKFNVKQSRKDGSSVHEHHTDPPSATENHLSSRSKKKMGINNDSSFIGSSMPQHHMVASEGTEFASLRKASSRHAFSTGRSKKFSSLRKKLLSVRHASVAESKKNLGRKLLNMKKPRLHCISRSDEEEALVSRAALHRQDNLVRTLGENAAQLEKETGRPLINRTRVLKIRKKMGETMNTGRGEIIAKGLDTLLESDSHGVRKDIDSFAGGSALDGTSNVVEEEAEMLNEFVCEPTYKVADGEAFVSFSKSLDSAFPGLACPNVECVPQYYGKAYDRHSPTELVLGADQEMFCVDKVGKSLVTHDSHVVAEMEGDEAQGNYFVDVDPIPIPGPPGSFLPSPGRMCSEELQGHSSLTTCRIHSSEDEHEVVDMDSSDSPISEISAASNPVAARSNSISVVNLSSQSHSKHETQSRISKDRSKSLVDRRELNLLESRENLMLPEVTHKVENFQPCCCSWKDGSLQGGSLNYQESQHLRRRTMTSHSVLAQENQTSNNLNSEIHCYHLRSETPSMKEPPTPEPKKDGANSQLGYSPVLVSHYPEAIFPVCGDCESPSPSTPNPVLRLMGKNLMVVNKDDNASPQTQSCMITEHPGLKLHEENGLSTSNNWSEPHCFNHSLSRGHSSFDNMHPRIPAQHFNFSSSDGFKIPANYGPLQFSSMSFGASRDHEYAVGFNSIPDQLGSKIRLDMDTEKAGTPVHHYKTIDSSGGKHKEIIVIDDSSESETGLAVKATHFEVNMEAERAVGNVASMAQYCDSSRVNPFYSYQTRAYPRFTGCPMVPIGVPHSKGMNANLGKWNCVREGASAIHSNSPTASLPPSAVHLRSPVYFSPGFHDSSATHCRNING